MWLVLWNDDSTEAECIAAETHIIPSIITQHADLPPDLPPVLGLFCCGQTLSGRKKEVGRVEWEKARVEGAEKELARSDGEMVLRCLWEEEVSYETLHDVPKIVQ